MVIRTLQWLLRHHPRPPSLPPPGDKSNVLMLNLWHNNYKLHDSKKQHDKSYFLL